MTAHPPTPAPGAGATEVRRLVISGGVQGVGFRHSLAQEATLLGLTGWVRNRSGGEVEAVIQGEAEAVAALIAWSRLGPPAARVDHVHVEHLEAGEGRFVGFEQRPTT